MRKHDRNMDQSPSGIGNGRLDLGLGLSVVVITQMLLRKGDCAQEQVRFQQAHVKLADLKDLAEARKEISDG